jgi:hypothetical protein
VPRTARGRGRHRRGVFVVAAEFAARRRRRIQLELVRELGVEQRGADIELLLFFQWFEQRVFQRVVQRREQRIGLQLRLGFDFLIELGVGRGPGRRTPGRRQVEQLERIELR